MFERLFLSPRRRRARRAAQQFDDAETRRAAEHVFFFLESIAHVQAERIDPDAELSKLLGLNPNDLPFWRRVEGWLSAGRVSRLHTMENLRTGTVRHLINHLVVCRTCRI